MSAEKPSAFRGRIFFAIVLLLALGMVAATGLLVWKSSQVATGPSGGPGGPFELAGPDGLPVTDEDFRGKYMLIYFGYTSCPDVCPTTMADLGIALKKLGNLADAIQPLFITIDPARDTPPVLKPYTAQFSPRLLGLTGTAAQIKTVEAEYKVYSDIHRTGPGPGDYTMDHSSIFYLMAPDGHFLAILDAGQDGNALAADITRHLAEDGTHP